MSLLETWVASPLAAMLGWTLLHSLWQGALIVAVLALLLAASRSPRVRYAAACAALLAMLASFGVTLACVAPEVVRTQRALRLPNAFYPLPDGRAGGPALADSSLAAIVPWLAPCWMTGVWLFYLVQAAGWLSLGRLRRRGVCSVSEYWRDRLASLGAQLRIARPVMLLESYLTDVPVVLGHLRPVILVPAGLLAGMPAAQMEMILLHELAHVRRCDYLVNLLQRTLEGLFFYHPAAWWISRVIRAERESCCDDIAVAITGGAHEYAAALAALEENRARGREPALAATGGNLVMRIRRLLDPQCPSGAWSALLAALLFTATAGLAVAAWQAHPVQPDRGPAPASHAATTVYEKWLNEDVGYIIDEKERAAFLQLKTDPEREKFIEQFWERRNPAPGTAENAFKKEHYRRIAYANQRFAAGIPGWKTDRGRIYIQYGPPDEIESHPSGAAGGAPFEQWLYHNLSGMSRDTIFTFRDRERDGNYV